MASSVFLLNGHKGLGTAFWIELFLDEDNYDEKKIHVAREYIEKTIIDFEKKYSRFKNDSLLSELNSKKSVKHDHDIAEMIRSGLEMSKMSNGVFSLFIKEKLEEKGYGNNGGAGKAILAEELKSDVTVTPSTITLIGNKGIDLGGVGKGYLIDLLAKTLQATFNYQYFVINGGGDIYVTSNHGMPIGLHLEHPFNQGESIGMLSVTNKAFCSSSSFKRRWKKDGEDVNHFIADKEVWAASYVLGDIATTTDMCATVYCIESDNKEAMDTLSQITATDYMVITKDGILLKSHNFPNALTTE